MSTTTHKPVSEDVAGKILDQMEATFGKWDRRGYCPCCIARAMLVHAGLLAAHAIQPEDMQEALGYIARLSEKYAPPPDDAVPH